MGDKEVTEISYKIYEAIPNGSNIGDVCSALCATLLIIGIGHGISKEVIFENFTKLLNIVTDEDVKNSLFS